MKQTAKLVLVASTGFALGAGAIVLLKNVISAYTQRWLMILGAIYIMTILGAPQGLWNLRWRSRSRA